MNVAIYARKSKATKKGESISNQIELCKKYFDIWHSVGCEIVVKASFIDDARIEILIGPSSLK